MANLKVKYMGLDLRNPIVIGSSGLSGSLDNIKKFNDSGAGAIVLKSIFEEQIRFETNEMMNDSSQESMKPMLKGYEDIISKQPYDYAEAIEYVKNFAGEQTLKKYLDFIVKAKKASGVPIIASINCNSAYDWHYFARRIEEAGADALELNIYVLPSDFSKTSEENEKIYFDIIAAVLKQVKIPVSIKIGYYFSSLANTLYRLSNTGIKGMVLFNRPYSPDIDINNFTITNSNIFSGSNEFAQSLRWIALLSGNSGCDIGATCGIHHYDTAIKMILAGASTVQFSSALYKNGFIVIEKMIAGIEEWMAHHKFENITDFKGKLSQNNIKDKVVYERVQFMKLYSDIN